MLKTPQFTDQDHEIIWDNLPGSSLAFAIHELASQQKKPWLVITPDILTAEQLIRELRFLSEQHYAVTRLPDWETLPFDHFSPHEDIISDRLRTLYQLPQMANGVIVAAITTLMHRLLPQTFLQQHTLMLKTGQSLQFEQYKRNLVDNGYRHSAQVLSHGEFAYRGAILDIFPMGLNHPLRIELFDNEIESIRHFDIETQRSTEKIDRIELLPAREYPLDENGITHFRQHWREQFSGNPLNAPLYQQISNGIPANGSEYYLALFFDKLATIFDYLPTNTALIFADDPKDNAAQFSAEAKERYQQLSGDIQRPILPPAQIYLSLTDFFTHAKTFSQVKLFTKKVARTQQQADISLLPDIKIAAQSGARFNKLKTFIAEHPYKIILCAESNGRRETLLDLLHAEELFPAQHDTFTAALNAEQPLNIVVAPFDKGFIAHHANITLICEGDLLGERVQQRRLRSSTAAIDPDAIIRNLNELTVGAAIVHLQHGIGRYLGLETITTSDMVADYISLGYADKAKIYVPVSSLNLISRYTGVDSEHAPISKLGSKKWDREKHKAFEKIRDTAVELLELYAQREATAGFAFSKPNVDYFQFAQSFAFETTPDQQRAIDDVFQDMQRQRCMDRLVCGDVGFGKTEVAMRAAFLAVQNNKQVAMLVPTTLLATQHGQTFKDRFADFPVKIAVMSRGNSAKEAAEIRQQLANGKIDIIIGTHGLLGDSIQFKNLGLLIVDEEHRFGVHQKDRIKKLSVNTDALTLTATPIPRTLSFALAGTRDLSIISTPPPKRRSIKTFIHESSNSLIREALLREILRGGQVYFLHNKVETIQTTAHKLREMLPEARVIVGHGQMNERELERVMSDFYHQKYNVLVATTIIESGIDVPTANTIIIDRADKFGLAQLHQLRGRVGRSHHQAYAYLLTPPWKVITSDAKKRLEAFEQLGDLGIGFSLATHDLEIRGAGELLGDEQSGHMQTIGFSLYMELLSEAVKSLKLGKTPQLEAAEQMDIEIKLGVSSLFPETYINDIALRLTLYKRLASCENDHEIQQFKSELIDRFGLLPEPAQHLFSIAKIKCRAKKIGLRKIELTKDFGYLHFTKNPNMDPINLIKLIQSQPNIYKLQGPEVLRVINKNQTADEKFNFLNKLLNKLTA